MRKQNANNDDEEMEDLSTPLNVNSPIQMNSVAKKLKTRSSFSAYQKHNYFRQQSSLSNNDDHLGQSGEHEFDQLQQHQQHQFDENENDQDLESNNNKKDIKQSKKDNAAEAKALKDEQKKKELLKSRQTDGYFNKDNDQPIKTKKKTKKHIFARRATYLPRADKKRLSMKIVDEFRVYSRDYIDHGHGTLYNTLSWACCTYMYYFSRIMRVCGDVCQKLEDKYTSENVGYGMMIMSNTFYLVPTIFIKCNPQIDFSLAVMSRGIMATIFICQMAHVKQQELIQFPRHDFSRLIFRGVFTAVSQLYFFFALGKLPLSINMIISNTGPIFVFIMSVIFFDGHMRANDIVGILIAVFGVFCVSNPALVTSFFTGSSNPATVAAATSAAAISTTVAEQTPSEGFIADAIGQAVGVVKQYAYAEGTEKLIYICAFLIVYVGWAYGVLIVKQLQKANTLAMNFFVALSFVLVGAFTMLFRPASIFNLSGYDLFCIVFVIGLFSFASQYTFITSTFLNHNHGPLTMLGYLSVIKSYIIQVVFFHEMPSLAEVVGSILVLLGVAKIVIH